MDKIIRYFKIWISLYNNSLTRDMEFKANFIGGIIVDFIYYGTHFFFFSIIFSYVDSLLEFTKHDVMIFLVITFLSDTFFMLFFITAPYGRHNKKMGLMISGKWGWIIQETISPLTFGYFFLAGNSLKTPSMWIFFILWIGHYFNRSIIYPIRQKNAKDTALIVVFSAILFNRLES